MLSALKYIQNSFKEAWEWTQHGLNVATRAADELNKPDVPKSLRLMIGWIAFVLPFLLFLLFYEALIRPLFVEHGAAYTFIIVIVVLVLLPFLNVIIFFATIPLFVYILSYPLIYAKRLLKEGSKRPRWAGFLVIFTFSTLHAAAAVVIAGFAYQVIHFLFMGYLDARTITLTLFILLILFASYCVMVARLKRGDFGYYLSDIERVVPIVMTYSKRQKAVRALLHKDDDESHRKSIA